MRVLLQLPQLLGSIVNMGSDVLTLAVRSTATELVPGKAQSDLQLARVALAGVLDAELQRRLQEQRLADRERHYHKEIWTKDPHGGPHRKVPPLRPQRPQPLSLSGLQGFSGCSSTALLRSSLAFLPAGLPINLSTGAQYNTAAGYDPLLELPDGQKRKPALGYERPLIGATTNFVGNHMTQAPPAPL